MKRCTAVRRVVEVGTFVAVIVATAPHELPVHDHIKELLSSHLVIHDQVPRFANGSNSGVQVARGTGTAYDATIRIDQSA